MQFIYIVVLLFMFFVSSIYAKSYIKLTNYSTKYEAFTLNKKLHKLGYSVILKKKTRKYYSLYLGPFQREDQAKLTQKRLKSYFPKSYVFTLGKNTKKTTNQRLKILPKVDKRQGNFSTSFSLGYSSFPSTHTIQKGSVTIKQPKTDGFSQNIGFNYLWNQDFRIGIHLMRMSSDDLIFTNIYTSIDYRFKRISNIYFPYFGILGGYTLLKWNTDPIESETSNNDSQSFFYGTHVGIIHKLSPFWDLVVDYQCIFMDHTTNLQIDTDNRSKLQHNISNTLQLGLQYHF